MEDEAQRGRALIEPRRQSGEPVLSGPGLLLLNPADLRQAGELLRQAGWRRRRLFHADLWQDSASSAWLAGPAVGAPMAALLLEKLLALGADRVIAVGWAGGLQPDLEIGELLLPTAAWSEEGTSSHYRQPPPRPGDGRPWLGDRPGPDGQSEWPAHTRPDPELLAELAAFLRRRGAPPRQGPVWTTDAPYRETVAKIQAYRRAGIYAVEMEFAALAAVASFRQRELAAVLLISDQLHEQQGWQPAFDRREFRRRVRRLLTLLLEYL